jgi:hypothetical protein
MKIKSFLLTLTILSSLFNSLNAQENKSLDTVTVKFLRVDVVEIGKKPEIIIRNPSKDNKLSTDELINLVWDLKNFTDDISKEQYLQIKLSTNNGYTFTVSLDSIKANSSPAIIKISDSKIEKTTELAIIKFEGKGAKDDEKIEGKTKTFTLEKKNEKGFLAENLRFFPGANFTYPNKLKLDGVFLGITVNAPKVLGNFGFDFYLAQGQTQTKDSSFHFVDSNNNGYSLNIRSNDNLYLAGALKFSFNDYIDLLFHSEFRKISSDVFDDFSNKYYRQIIRINPTDTIRIDSVFKISSRQKFELIQYDYFVGTGLGINFKNSDFQVKVKGLFGYNIAAKGWDFIFRFNIRENKFGVNFGGDLRAPFTRTENRRAEYFVGNEVLIYLAKEISLTGLSDLVFGEVKK